MYYKLNHLSNLALMIIFFCFTRKCFIRLISYVLDRQLTDERLRNQTGFQMLRTNLLDLIVGSEKLGTGGDEYIEETKITGYAT